MYNTIKELINAPGVSGREEKICEKLKSIIAPLSDEVSIDNMGNLIALKRGNGKNNKKIMLCAHMDEIGFLVNYIEDNGMVRVATLGGIHLAASAYSKVVSERGTLGVLVPKLALKNKTKRKTISNIIPDNWVYVHDRSVTMGRFQIYNNWSPYMVKDLENTVWIGLEYFVTEGDNYWNMTEAEFAAWKAQSPYGDIEYEVYNLSFQPIWDENSPRPIPYDSNQHTKG
jgi:uncharacterized membrane protein YozB (DUF420 family)